MSGFPAVGPVILFVASAAQASFASLMAGPFCVICAAVGEKTQTLVVFFGKRTPI